MMRLVLITAVASMFAASCATVKGVGKDVQSVGEAGQKAINGAKKK